MNGIDPDNGELERAFEVFGSTARILIGTPRTAAAEPPALLAYGLERSLGEIHHALTRFEPGSELSRLNADERETVAVSALLAAFLQASASAAKRSGGLVDATVLGAVEECGYRTSMSDRRPASLEQALSVAPPRRPARPRRGAHWSQVSVDVEGRSVRRPPGLRFDSGGIAKGLAVDVCAGRLAGHSSFAVDCGGDIRIGGHDGLLRRVEVGDPFSGEPVAAFNLTRGAVATSGLRRRVWADGGRFAHHLIDPGRSQPAWTGLIQASAIAPTALEAETLAKAALLSGPAGAEPWLARWGGVVFDDTGSATSFGPLRAELAEVQAV